MDPLQFLSALLAIIVIDIVLAGDNAIVIALATRSLPAQLQRRAIVWGALGAVCVRSLMTVVVVWLLRIPGLLLLGGAMLIWIAYHLLRADERQGEAGGRAIHGFWAAMRTIVVADAVMGLDNVLAVAGAAHGSYLLVVTGLSISVPIVVWGSTLVLKLVNRFPAIVYLGAGVLVLTSVKMVIADPLIQAGLATAAPVTVLAYLAIPIVLWLGFVGNHRQFESRIHARLAEFAQQRPLGASSSMAQPQQAVESSTGGRTMLKVLVPLDGCANGLMAVRHVIAEYRRHHELELHLLNVQPRLYRHISRFVNRRTRHAWQQEMAEAAMASARAELLSARVPHHMHWVSGDRAAEICRAAKRLGVHHIVMGTARKNSITRLLEDSVTNRVLETTPVPVEVVVGAAVSKWERWGVPAGALAGIGSLLWLAID